MATDVIMFRHEGFEFILKNIGKSDYLCFVNVDNKAYEMFGIGNFDDDETMVEHAKNWFDQLGDKERCKDKEWLEAVRAESLIRNKEAVEWTDGLFQSR